MSKILIIDDEPNIVEVLEKLFLHKGYEVEKANSGFDGLEIIEKEQDIDIIVVDEKMPKMSGADFAKLVQERSKEIPLIMLTGSIGLSQLEDIRRAKCEYVLYKPVRPSELAQLVEDLLSKR